MPLQNNSSNQKIVWLSLFIAIGLILFVFESYIPRPLPWLKPGLANISTLLALYLFGFQEALIVVACRIVLGSLLVGTFLNPTFDLAMGGGISAAQVMSLIKKIGRSTFSIFGVSIAGALMHNISQLILVIAFLVQRIQVLYLLPLMMFSSLFSGFVVAFVSHYLIERIHQLKGFSS